MTTASESAVKEPTIFDLFETSADTEVKGVLLRYGSKIRILVARAGGANVKYERIITKATKPYRKIISAIQAGTATEADAKVIDNILQDAYSKAVVLGWEGVTERDGTEIPFTPDNCVSLFKRIPALWTDIQAFASNYINFLAENTEEVSKN